MRSPTVALVLCLSSCVRAGFSLPSSADAESGGGSGDAGDALARLDAPKDSLDRGVDRAVERSGHDASHKTQKLGIQKTEDDGEITGGLFCTSGETWNDKLLFAGSWASGLTTPELTYVFLRFELSTAIPAKSTVESVVLELYGHDPTSYGSSWDASQHELLVTADLQSDAQPITDETELPGTSTVPQTTAKQTWPASGGLAWKSGQWNSTPNLAALLQELVDTYGGLQAGAHVQLWLRSNQTYSVDAELPFEDTDSAGGRSAVLMVTWL
jgi:hypothetical protein